MANARTIAIDKMHQEWRQREQLLIDTCFAIAMHAESLTGLDNEKRAEWVRYQLGCLGWADLQPMGMSWGVLTQ